MFATPNVSNIRLLLEWGDADPLFSGLSQESGRAGQRLLYSLDSCSSYRNMSLAPSRLSFDTRSPVESDTGDTA